MDVNIIENHDRPAMLEGVKDIAKRADIGGERHPQPDPPMPVIEYRGERLDACQPSPGASDDGLNPVLYGGRRGAIAARRKQDFLERSVAFERVDPLTQISFAPSDALVSVERNAIPFGLGEGHAVLMDQRKPQTEANDRHDGDQQA